jgi:hypothetical protein
MRTFQLMMLEYVDCGLFQPPKPLTLFGAPHNHSLDFEIVDDNILNQSSKPTMSIYDLVDKHEQLVKNSLEWNTSLPFVVSSSFLLSQDSPSLFGAKFKEEDLFELVSPTGLLVSDKKW